MLDPFFTNFPAQTTTKVLPKVADHNATLTTLNFPSPTTTPITREVLDFNKADWDSLNNTFRLTNWHDFFTNDPDADAAKLTDYILTTTQHHVPRRTITEKNTLTLGSTTLAQPPSNANRHLKVHRTTTKHDETLTLYFPRLTKTT